MQQAQEAPAAHFQALLEFTQVEASSAANFTAQLSTDITFLALGLLPTSGDTGTAPSAASTLTQDTTMEDSIQ